MIRINSLKIRKLGNVAPGTELTFGPLGAVLLGRNGTGKTTLLNILTSIGRCDLESLSDEDYDVDFSMSWRGQVELKVSAKCEKVAPADPPTLLPRAVADTIRKLLQERPRRQSLQLEIIQITTGERTLIESTDHKVTCSYSDGARLSYSAPATLGWQAFWPAAYRDGQPTSFIIAITELWNLSTRLRRFDEGLDYFRHLTEAGPDSAYIESHRDNSGIFGINNTTRLISFNCAHLLMDNLYKSDGTSPFSVYDSTKVKYLEQFCELAGFERAAVWADLDKKWRIKDGEIVALSPLRFSLTRNGSHIHHRHLSFGQCRLLAFLHYQDSTRSFHHDDPTRPLLIADELVNGMHYEWISRCMEIMRDAQAFLSSQNPLLFDFLSFESAEDVAERFIICDLDEQHRFVWRNMSDAEALEFYETHKAGLQHASEILRTRGYW